MKRIVMGKYYLIIIFAIFSLIAVGIIGYKAGKGQSSTAFKPASPAQKNNQPIEESSLFPPLKMPIEYFDSEELSMGATENGMSYEVIPDADAYRSYPSTNISLESSMYSSIPADLPPIKTDDEIHEKDSDVDNFGNTKQENVKKYGNLGRRFVGASGIATTIYSVRSADVDNDGKSETIVSLSETGANVLASWDVIIKGDKIIFSTSGGTFSTIIPAKNGNGFFMEWDDNFKKYDGYMTTKFIFDGEKFTPVYEQLTRYIRISTK